MGPVRIVLSGSSKGTLYHYTQERSPDTRQWYIGGLGRSDTVAG
jgi:hypothetical protein